MLEGEGHAQNVLGSCVLGSVCLVGVKIKKPSDVSDGFLVQRAGKCLGFAGFEFDYFFVDLIQSTSFGADDVVKLDASACI